MTIDKYIANFVTRIQCDRLWLNHYIEQSRTKHIDAPILLYGLAGVMVGGI